MKNERQTPPWSPDVTVHHARSLADVATVQADLVGADVRAAQLFLAFAQETTGARNDETLLHRLIASYTFRAFPQATHLVLASRDDSEGLIIRFAESREGDTPAVALSTMLVRQVIDEGIAVLFSHGEMPGSSSDSLVLSRIQTAVCAPLQKTDETFGVMQLDIRGSSRGLFGRKDLDRLTVFAHHVGLVIDNLRLAQEQERAFQSTIGALVHSLSLKDPDTAAHSERVQAVSLCLGEAMGLSGRDLEGLSLAALVHDLGKQGVRNGVLHKPAKLTETERTEMSHHSVMTQNILDKIVYPRHLRKVPQYAAYHHETLTGTGPYKLSADEIPVQAKIISVADAFDALLSPRVYKKAKSPEEVMGILNKGRNKAWCPNVLDTLESILPELLVAVYSRSDEESEDIPDSRAA